MLSVKVHMHTISWSNNLKSLLGWSSLDIRSCTRLKWSEKYFFHMTLYYFICYPLSWWRCRFPIISCFPNIVYMTDWTRLWPSSSWMIWTALTAAVSFRVCWHLRLLDLLSQLHVFPGFSVGACAQKNGPTGNSIIYLENSAMRICRHGLIFS